MSVKGKTNSLVGSQSKTGAQLQIKALIGSTISLFKNDILLKILQPNQGIEDNTSTGCAVWFYTINPNNFGPLTIEVAINDTIETYTLNVTEQKLYEVKILPKIYFIKDGKFIKSPTRTLDGSKSSLTENANGYVVLHSNQVSSSYATCSFDAVDITNYEFLVFDGQGRGYYQGGGCPHFGLVNTLKSGSNYTTWRTATAFVWSSTNTFSTRAIRQIPISAYKGSYIVGFQEAGSAGSNVTGDIYCYNCFISSYKWSTQ